MYELAKLGGFFLAPLTMVMSCALVALALAFSGRGRAALVVGVAACGGLWMASTPAVAIALVRDLESRYQPLTVAATPPADAIVVLGGALSGAYPPTRPTFNLAPAAGRVWHAAALYRAGKARWVIVAAGNRPNDTELQPETQAIGEMLQALGVPRQALRLDSNSRNTRENARQALREARAVGARSVLLVTSAIHMERAVRTFEREWQGEPIRLIPATTDYWMVGTRQGLDLWFPTASALGIVTSALKEYAGTVALTIM
jgi:uncharacterized SAM-binding protein YcdF (DUF218 family)